jgi:hypothetical protein
MLDAIKTIIARIYPNDWTAEWYTDAELEVEISTVRGKGKIPDVMQALEAAGFETMRFNSKVIVTQGTWKEA